MDESWQRSPEPWATPCYVLVTVDGKPVDPTDELMASLAPRSFPIMKGSLCVPRQDGVFNKETGGKGGVLVTVGTIEWTGKDTAKADLRTWTGGTGASYQEFKCQWKAGRWEVTAIGGLQMS